MGVLSSDPRGQWGRWLRTPSIPINSLRLLNRATRRKTRRIEKSTSKHFGPHSLRNVREVSLPTMTLPPEITFLVSTKEQGGPQSLRFASKINKHVASYTHNKRRRQSDDEHRSLSRSMMTLGDRRHTWPADSPRSVDVASPYASELPSEPAKPAANDEAAHSYGEVRSKPRRKSSDSSSSLGQSVTDLKTSRNIPNHFNPFTPAPNTPRFMEPLLDHFIRLPETTTDMEKRFIYFCMLITKTWWLC